MEDQEVAEVAEATVDPPLPKIREHNCLVEHPDHGITCMEWNLTMDYIEGKKLEALKSFIRLISVRGCQLDDRNWRNPATGNVYKDGEIIVVLNDAQYDKVRPSCNETGLGDTHDLVVYGAPLDSWVVTNTPPPFSPALYPNGLVDFVAGRENIIEQRRQAKIKAEKERALVLAEKKRKLVEEDARHEAEAQARGMRVLKGNVCCGDFDNNTNECWRHGRHRTVFIFPGEEPLLEKEVQIGDRIRIVNIPSSGISGHHNPNTDRAVQEKDVFEVIALPLKDEGWGPAVLLPKVRLYGTRNITWVLTDQPINGKPELIEKNSNMIQLHIKVENERAAREKLEKEVYVKTDDVPPTDWKAGESWMRALVAAPFLQRHMACEPPMRYVRGWPMETPAADIWHAVINGKPNPLGQRVEFYWFGRILGYVPNLQRELLTKIKEAGWKRGSEAHFEDPEFRALLDKAISWPELEFRLRESHQYYVTKWEVERGLATSPPKKEPPAIPVDGNTKKKHKGNKKMMNTDRVKHIAAFLADTAAPALGLKADFSDHLGRRLSDVEEFLEKAAKAKGAAFTAVDGKTDERMDALEDFLKANAPRVNLTYYKFGERAAPAKAVAKGDEAVGTDLEARVTKLEAFARQNGYRG